MRPFRFLADIGELAPAGDSPHILVGSVEGLVEKLLMLRERLGISSFMVGDADEMAPVVERRAGR